MRFKKGLIFLKTSKKFKRTLAATLAALVAAGYAPAVTNGAVDIFKTSITASADDPYASIKNTTTAVHFDSKDWYLIDYDSTTVTLLAKECVAASEFDDYILGNNNYYRSTVRAAVNSYYANSISADAKTAVLRGLGNDMMFLLSTEQAQTISNPDVLKCSQYTGAEANRWWLRPTDHGGLGVAPFVYGATGSVPQEWADTNYTYGVRPALKLNLSSVIFSSESNTFTLKSAHTHSFTYSASGATITASCTDCFLTEPQRKITISAPTSLAYDGTGKAATLSTGYDTTNAFPYVSDITYKKGNEALTGAPTEIGTYTASVSAGASAENCQTATVTFTITKGTPTYTVPANLTATYGQTLADVTLPTGWTWADSTQSVGDVVSPANTFKAKFTPADTTNYNTVENIDVPVTVSKADPIYTVPTGLTAIEGETLKDVVLPTTANGTWSWVEADTTDVGNVGDHTFHLKFTPNDTTNYNIIDSIEVTVTVVPAVTYTRVPASSPTCTSSGNIEYYRGSDNKYYTKSGDTYTETTRAAVTIRALGHNWGTPTYTWSADNSTVTAERVCSRNGRHKETETVSTTSEVTKEPTTTENGVRTYTSAAFTNGAFSVQTKTEEIPALMPDYDAPVYTWSADNSSVTAVRVCRNDDAATITETVNTTSSVTKSATCESNGETTYTAFFADSAFTAQTKTLANIPATGHLWGDWVITKEPTYTEKGEKQRVCLNDPSHIETEEIPVKDAVYFTVSFDSAGGTYVVSQSVHDGKTASRPADPTRSGYTFRYWSLGGTAYDFSTPVTGNITLTAVWTENYTPAPTPTYTEPSGYIMPEISTGTGQIDTTPIVQPQNYSITGVQTEEHASGLTWDARPEAKSYSLYINVNGKNVYVQELGESTSADVVLSTDGKYYVSAGGDYTVYTYKNGKFVKTGTLPADEIGTVKKANNVTTAFMVKYTKADGTVSSDAESYKVSVKVYYKPAAKATVKNGIVSLKWNPVPNAEKYRVYVLRNGKLKLLKEIDKSNINIRAASGNHTYAVKALVNEKWTTVLKSDLINVTVE